MLSLRVQEAIELMTDFAERTGLSSERPKQRYLWTDAFAVCNFLGLARATRETRYAERALLLVDQVHHTLGRYRRDDLRTGWVSGLTELEGEAHPTAGGLRIGKGLPERRPDQLFDERLEWDRDGQYFHYLTKWMHALDQAARFKGQRQFNVWARELAETAHRAFTYSSPGNGPRRMYWKMSVDLTRPLVASMGQHDPLDGYVTYVQLRSTADSFPISQGDPDLQDEIRQLQAMVAPDELATADPLGLGSLLTDAFRVHQLMGPARSAGPDLLETLLAAALAGLQYYVTTGELRMPADHRLAFRELGLAIGLHAVRLLAEAAGTDSTPDTARSTLRELMQYSHLGDSIESFWRDAENRRSRTWSEHRDINQVMLATSLVPEGFLVLLSPD